MSPDKNDKNIRDELYELVQDAIRNFLHFLRPSPEDTFLVQIIKMLVKIPVAVFMVVLSPVLLVILAIIFILLL